MALPVFFFLAAIAVRTNQTPLRSGCEANDDVIASIPAGTPVNVQFRLSDGTDCFKISVTVDGKQVLGYLPAGALTGLAQFNAGQTAAEPATESVDVPPAVSREALASSASIQHPSDPAITRAAQLLNASQPAEALDELQQALQRRPHDANILMLAGLAAYRSDRITDALDYWKQSLDIAPNKNLAAVYETAKREAAADHSGDRLYGAHIALRYEGESLPADTARAILALLDHDYARISEQLGCTPDERIVAIVQNRDAYLRSTGAAEWSGGQYDGRIHIAWTDGAQLGPEMQRTLAHELVHACLTTIPSGAAPWPAWLQEGLAQKLSGDALPPGARAQLQQLAQTHAIPRLEKLGQDWSGLSTPNAVAAYGLALAAADALFENYANYGIRNLLRNPEQLPHITSDLDAKLGFPSPAE